MDAVSDDFSVWTPGQPYIVTLFYRYTPIFDPQHLQRVLTSQCNKLGLLGRILLASEGINGTLAGSVDCINAFIEFMKTDQRFSQIDWKSTLVDVKSHIEDRHSLNELPFLDLSVRIVNEIISCGRQRDFINGHIRFDSSTFGGIDGTGKHLKAPEFHTAIEQLESSGGMLLDIRNQFEYEIGRFDGALPLQCATYSESWIALDGLLQGKEASTPVYMYCTGGVRCEKASAYVRSKGFENVFQLEGGIHR